MSKVGEIIMGASNLIVKSEEIEILSKERMEICNKCPFKVKQLGLDVCEKCGCILKLKTRSVESKCPENKWIR